MTIKQHGGVFGRNPAFNDVSVETLSIAGTALSSTAAELNILDGVTSTTAELNILDGVTATTAELNILDGVTADATEINYLDGASTSAVVASKAVLADASGNIAFPNGKGIDFSADGQAAGMTSELLDDYEEGTWTPAFGAESGTATVTYSTQVGRYAKIGRQVICEFRLQWTAATITGNILRLEGVPFNGWDAGSISGFITRMKNVGFVNVSGGTGTQLALAGYDVNKASLFTAGDSLNSADLRLGPSQIAATGELRGTIIYSV